MFEQMGFQVALESENFVMYKGYGNHNFRRISRFISETIQVMAIVTMEDECEAERLVSDLSNSAIFH